MNSFKPLNLSAMKRTIWILLLSALFSGVFGQKSVDALFSKYAGSEGFTTVTISGDLLKLAKLLDDDKDYDSLPAEITEIRILAQDDHDMKIDNFYDRVMDDINLADYDDFMKVRNSGQELRMLVRTEGNRFREFLLVGGGKDNVLIQIKGNMTLREAKRLSSDFKNNHGKGCLTAVCE